MRHDATGCSGIRVRIASAIACMLVLSLPVAVSGQAQPKTDRGVFVRELHVDPLILSFGLDTVRLRAALEQAARRTGRLRPDSVGTVPSLDIALIVPRPVGGGESDPRALLRVEVGRNLMEDGKSRRLIWEQSITLPAYVTWRALTAAAERQVLSAVEAYFALPSTGD